MFGSGRGRGSGMVSRDENEFDAVVEGGGANAVRGQPAFERFIRLLPGVYPSVARDALRRLGACKKVSPAIVERLLAEASSERVSSFEVGTPSKLPVPHPLDYEWRYAESAADRLVA